MTSSRSAWIFAWALLAPAIIYVLIIVAWPLVETLRLSFTDASLRKEVNFVGWRNYEKIFNETFLTVITRTFIWTFFSVLLKMIIGMCGAVLLNAAVPAHGSGSAVSVLSGAFASVSSITLRGVKWGSVMLHLRQRPA